MLRLKHTADRYLRPGGFVGREAKKVIVNATCQQIPGAYYYIWTAFGFDGLAKGKYPMPFTRFSSLYTYIACLSKG